MTREDIEKKMHESAEEIKPLVTTLVEALCEAHQKGYLAGVELGAKMAYPHWIPVEEELPKRMNENSRFSDTVLVYNKGGYQDTAYYDYEEKIWRWLPGVTHWMPLPEAPRKEE